jgi:phospholipid/cholesterol/gamma-HCH transport system substrate-binding protein
MSRETIGTRIRYQLMGVAFLLVVALFFVVTVASYRKAFTPTVPVSLETDYVGNQLRVGADVKIRGMVVGEVSSISSDGDGAVLGLALRPDTVDAVPANVSARLLPKTLFGERYVALQPPADPARDRLSEGDVIPQDRSGTAIELERVLSGLMPLLQAVRPEKVASTLNALSQALDGRGEQFGATLVRLDQYLRDIEPSLPDLKADIAALASVSETFADAAPDLVRSMSNLATTSRTFLEQQDNLRSLSASLTNAAVDLTSFLEVNRSNLINLVSASRPTAELLARYSPEYPCMLKQIAERVGDAEYAFGKGHEHPNMMRVTLEFTANRGKYLPGVDDPEFNDNRGPRCYAQVPHPGVFPQYPPDGPLDDGSSKPPPPRKQNGETYILPGSTGGTAAGTTSPQSVNTTTTPSVANSTAEHDLVGLLTSSVLGGAPEDVPGWIRFLVAPVYRGIEVTVR